MEGNIETPKPSVVKINSTETWDSHLQEAKSHGTPRPACGRLIHYSQGPSPCNALPKGEWRGHKEIVAHFTASWCIPSVAMNPIFEELASIFPDISFLTVDVDDSKEIASKYKVKAMPTFVLMKEGVVVGRLVGANPDEIKKRIETLLQSNTDFVV